MSASHLLAPPGKLPEEVEGSAGPEIFDGMNLDRSSGWVPELITVLVLLAVAGLLSGSLSVLQSAVILASAIVLVVALLGRAPRVRDA